MQAADVLAVDDAAGDIDVAAVPLTASAAMASSGGGVGVGAAVRTPALHRVALIFAYTGARFKGMQKNPGAFTVEDELERCLREVGALPPGDFAAVRFAR